MLVQVLTHVLESFHVGVTIFQVWSPNVYSRGGQSSLTRL